MRWENLEKGACTQGALPGVGDAVVRTFDAPEALGVRFHEVEARSALNHVPKRSRMPFRWTINPYRGCTHACVYCMSGETPILLADGRTKPLARIQAGDRVYGTVLDGGYRRYVRTIVLAHWATIKPAYRIELEDGTSLIASGDHRFLTEHGWKFVAGHRGRGGRPHLTTNNRLKGTGRFASSPQGWLDFDYRRGYLCGLIRGDGHVSSSTRHRRGRQPEPRHIFRLAMTDLEPVSRAREYLAMENAATHDYVAQDARTARQAVTIVQAGSRAAVASVRECISWPARASESWCKGFLAGIFDAEGSRSGGTLRIANTDAVLIDWVAWCLRRLRFTFRVERTTRPNGLKYVRLLGGVSEQLRFLHVTDPAATRKRSIEGVAVKTFARLHVASIEPIAKSQRLYDITTGTGNFIANGVVSHNCFARPTHTYLDLNAREDFEREIVVKVNVPEVLRTELRRPSWKRDHVALGTNTDPYQWVEGRYRLTRGVWEAMRDFSNPCSVLTKSPLLLRDLDVFRELVERTEFSANLSIPTLEEKAWRATEPHTPHPRKRIEAVAELVRSGIPTGVLVAPLIPGVNDDPEQVEELLGLLGDAGAESVSGIGLHLRGEVKEIWFDWLRQYRPDLMPRYEELYRRGAYLPKDEARRLSDLARGPSRARRLREHPAAEPEPATEGPSPAPQPKLF